MFERYTEHARRAIFFARYEASQFGSPEIGTEHLLLGIVHEYPISGTDVSFDALRNSVKARVEVRPPISTTVDLPFTHEAKRSLAYGAEEAERLNHRHIGCEHLLLGLLREDDSLSARILREHKIDANAIRKDLVPGSQRGTEPNVTFEPAVQNIDRQILANLRAINDQLAELSLTIHRIEKRLDELSSRPQNPSEK